MSSRDETCDHHDAQVGIRIIDYAPEERAAVDETCNWCGDEEVVGTLVKSERHKLSLCEECRDLLQIVVQNGGEE